MADEQYGQGQDPSQQVVPQAYPPQATSQQAYDQNTYQQPYQQTYQQQPYQEQPYQQPYQQQPYQQPYQQPMYQQPYQAPVKDNSTLYIVISVLEIIFLGGVFAIIPLVYSIQYKNALSAYNFPLAEDKSKMAVRWLIIAPCIAIVIGIIAMIYIFSVAGMTTSM